VKQDEGNEIGHTPSGHEILSQSAIDSDRHFWTGKRRVSVFQWIGVTLLWITAGIVVFLDSFDVGATHFTILQRIASASMRWIIAVAVLGGMLAFIRWRSDKQR
jgi:hypothetical protein